jgi:hypothetical protein
LFNLGQQQLALDRGCEAAAFGNAQIKSARVYSSILALFREISSVDRLFLRMLA